MSMRTPRNREKHDTNTRAIRKSELEVEQEEVLTGLGSDCKKPNTNKFLEGVLTIFEDNVIDLSERKRQRKF